MSKKVNRVLIVSQYFYPENFKVNDIAFELSKRGYSVTVLTGIPNYPQGIFFDGYGFFTKKKEFLNGVRILRTFLIPRMKGKFLFLNYISWAILASIKAFFLALFNKYDVIIVQGTSPVMQAFPAIVVKKIQKIPIYFWVLDLWPESLEAAGNIHNKAILSVFRSITICIYRQSDKILISSRGFKKSIIEKGNFEDKIIYFPNWAEDIFKSNEKKLDINIPNGFIIMFAGNIGESQNFEVILNAALRLRGDKDIHFFIIGEGRKRRWIESFIEKNDLTETVHLPGKYPLDMMPSFFARADIMLVSLKDELIFNITVPAKIQAYMMAGKPLLGVLNGEGAEIIKEAQCGFIVPSDDVDSLVTTIERIRCLDAEELIVMGHNGFIYCKEKFSMNTCIDNLENIIKP